MKPGVWREFSPKRSHLILDIASAPVWLWVAAILVVASPTTGKSQVLNSGTADSLAQSALSTILGDLQQEIVNGSSATTVGSTTIYTATSNLVMVPVRNGVPAKWSASGVANSTLLRVSSTTAITAPGVDQTASNALSTGTSANGRSIGRAAWNQHYLIQLKNFNTPTDSTPDVNFIAPSWVYVTGTGNPILLTSPTNVITGRYACAIYDEGALLDVNVAGFPCDPAIYGNQPGTAGTMASPYVSKGSTAFADITALGIASTKGAPSTRRQQSCRLA